MTFCVVSFTNKDKHKKKRLEWLFQRSATFLFHPFHSRPRSRLDHFWQFVHSCVTSDVICIFVLFFPRPSNYVLEKYTTILTEFCLFICVTVNISLHYINANRYDGIGGLWQSYIDTSFFSFFRENHSDVALLTIVWPNRFTSISFLFTFGYCILLYPSLILNFHYSKRDLLVNKRVFRVSNWITVALRFRNVIFPFFTFLDWDIVKGVYCNLSPLSSNASSVVIVFCVWHDVLDE